MDPSEFGHKAERGFEFPLWLRRIDPLLDSAPSNALFHAFRLRRSVYRPGAGRLLVDRRLQVRMALLLLGVLTAVAVFVFLLLNVGFGGAGLVAFIGVILVFTFVSGISLRTGNRSTLMPRSLREVFSQTGVRYFAVRDLYMTGTPTRELIEALYFENREKQAMVARWLSLLATILIPLITTWASSHWYGGIEFLSFQFLVLVGLSFLFAGAVQKVFGVLGMEAALFDIRRIRLESFRGQRRRMAGLWSVVKRLLEAVMLLFLVISVVFTTVSLLILVADTAARLVPREWVITLLVACALGGWCLVLMAFTWVGHRILQRMVRSGLALAVMDYDEGIQKILDEVPDR